MSDLVDVMNALRDVATAVSFPNGTSQPSITLNPVTIFCGWPSEKTLDAAMAANKAIISVFPKDIERDTTRYMRDEQITEMPVETITAVISGSTITLGGTISTPQNVGLIVNRLTYVHAVQASDTLITIATALAAAVNVDTPGTSSAGPVIKVAPTAQIQAARVGGSGTVATEVKRQERVFCITVWAPTPDVRDILCQALDPVLAAMDWLSLPDGLPGRLIYKNSPMSDVLQKTTIFRRDLNYSVEYPTTIISQAPAVILPVVGVAETYSASINAPI